MDNVEKACNELEQCFGLSSAESYILLLLSQGYSPKEIAEIRFRSIDTIRTHIKKIMQKTGVNRVNNVVLEVFNLAEKLSV